ncbi:alpha/beta hydrolase [Rhodococcus sp. 06-235-1A]|uniref:alpha/beta hydrolase n=1 Tax=Rhodococcus sp. 06-235-1A TaxID=2022508 RepID=UPI000B9A8AED|nr:alpha/beta hydrolase [Rhodococcus sp. 06-235-1A]OZD09317.1 alpha/beta hydrolase [Rhodococcus sp. 06-235-1A]
MDFDRYVRFLPEQYRSVAGDRPESTYWMWGKTRVHVARAARPESKVRVMALHGAGGYSGLLWPYAAIAAREGFEVMCPDLPLYGDTVVPDPPAVRYRDWIDLLCDLVVAENAIDERPLILFGASMGGMLAYEVAHRTGLVDRVIATCLLDPADPRARRAAARFDALGGPAPQLLRLLAAVAGRVKIPVRWMADMANMSLDSELSELCSGDPKGGGVRVPIGFLASFFGYSHIRPEDYDGPPVLLTHPAEDRWTPPDVSIRFLERIRSDTEIVMLDGCGHLPVEEPGLTQLAGALRAVLRTY